MSRAIEIRIASPADVDALLSLEHQGQTAEIDELFVAADFHGAGLGRELLAVAEDGFRVAGCTNISLQIGRDNEAARAFYRRQGFTDRAHFGLVDKNLRGTRQA
jgi:ribosomal protein S18 acetylase RimI-like enzyme